jgi:hypothetical protein
MGVEYAIWGPLQVPSGSGSSARAHGHAPREQKGEQGTWGRDPKEGKKVITVDARVGTITITM